MSDYDNDYVDDDQDDDQSYGSRRRHEDKILAPRLLFRCGKDNARLIAQTMKQGRAPPVSIRARGRHTLQMEVQIADNVYEATLCFLPTNVEFFATPVHANSRLLTHEDLAPSIEYAKVGDLTGVIVVHDCPVLSEFPTDYVESFEQDLEPDTGLPSQQEQSRTDVQMPKMEPASPAGAPSMESTTTTDTGLKTEKPLKIDPKVRERQLRREEMPTDVRRYTLEHGLTAAAYGVTEEWQKVRPDSLDIYQQSSEGEFVFAEPLFSFCMHVDPREDITMYKYRLVDPDDVQACLDLIAEHRQMLLQLESELAKEAPLEPTKPVHDSDEYFEEYS